MIVISDKRVLHALHDKKVKSLPTSFWERIPELLREPEQVLLGKAGRNGDIKQLLTLVYSLSADKERPAVALDYDVEARYPFTGKREHPTLNTVSTGIIARADKQVDSLLHGYEAMWKEP